MADVILYHANIITMHPTQPQAEMIAIRQGKILAVGNNNDISIFNKAGTKVIDCKGNTLMPGFHDAHCHILAFARSLLSIDCTPASVNSIRDIKALISDHVQQTAPGKWIIAVGYNEFYLAEKRHPTRWDLDEAAPFHPVKLNHRSGHACVLNSSALRLAGICRETPDPDFGLIERDLETGEPNGLLFEMNCDIDRVIPPVTEQEQEQCTRLANNCYLSMGITSLQDATADNDFNRWQTFQQIKDRGHLASRVSLMISPTALRQFTEQGILPGSGSNQVHLGSVKIILDETTGSLYPPQEELNHLVLQAQNSGFQVALHALEENTLEAAITALEYASSLSPRLHCRHRIEHCSVCPPPLMKRLKDISAIIVTQPSFLYYNGERYLAEIPSEKLSWLYRFKSFWDNGLMPAASSDSPVVPPNPLTGIYAAVTRKAKTGQIILAEEAISTTQAMAMYTSNAAFATFTEKYKGTISPGKLADLVVLGKDPTQMPPETIKDIPVLMTIINGEVAWKSNH